VGSCKLYLNKQLISLGNKLVSFSLVFPRLLTKLIMSDERSLSFPSGYTLEDLLSGGNTGLILRRPGSAVVIKIPLSDQGESIVNELKVYKRLTDGKECDRIVQCYGSFENGIKLEFLPGGCLTPVLERMAPGSELQLRLRWATQLTEALRFIHSRNIYYWDLSCNNLVLDSSGDLKMVDFADAELMGDFPLGSYCHDNHICPSPNPNTQHDIFNLGITLYHIMIGSLPYEKDKQLTSHKIKEQYRQNHFKSFRSLPMIREIVNGCWKGKYTCLDEIFLDIRKEHGWYRLYSRQTCLTIEK
jgi:serine/threonine protein kinase